MKLTTRDRERMRGVHPDLVKVIEIAAQRTFLSWFVVQGVRSMAEHKKLLLNKPSATRTTQSRHIPRLVEFEGARVLLGHAVDLGLYTRGKDYVQSFEPYHALAAEVLDVAARQGVPVHWGGLFRNKKGNRFADGGHFELDADAYPLPPLDI